MLNVPSLLRVFFIFLVLSFYWNQLKPYFSIENTLGTIYSPISDPLTPWLHGGVVYYLDEVPIWDLFRPSIGIYISSFLTLGNFYWIPYFIVIYFIFHLGFLLYISSFRLFLTGIGSLIYFGAFHEDYFTYMSPQSIAPDFFAFHLTFIGIFSILVSLEQSKLSLYTLGLFHIGIAAAIRAFQFPGLFVLYILGLVWFCFRRRNYKKQFLLISLSFLLSLLPVFLDGFIRNKYKVVNNFTPTLYCIYKYNYCFSPECFKDYLELKMNEKTQEVYTSYVNYIFTSEGKNLINSTFTSYFNFEKDRFFKNKWFVAVSIFIGLIINRKFLFCFFCRKYFYKRKFLFKLISLHIFVFLSILSIYVFGLGLFSLLLGVGWLRTLVTLSSGYVLSFFYLLFPIFKNSPRRKYNFLKEYYFVVTSVILFLLFFSNFIFPKPLAKEFKKRNEKENVIFKLSDDHSKGLSLWYGRFKGNLPIAYTDTGFIYIYFFIYTYLDEKPKWKVYSFENLEFVIEISSLHPQAYYRIHKIHFK